MLRQIFAIKRYFARRVDNVDSLIGQVRDMTFRHGQMSDDLMESLAHAETILERCEVYRKSVR
jgi:hypothetical protein